ncbi:MAG TPA: tripartite tricarboxylate transporter TctB family protein [Virgibacillus sp.]|nr:tripartite tricarboxylate transporter TctB family protein [Virgibacillus sp.]HLR69230.1 tripartite tricarboxylate transporter TctB family protein [Virgibacillus sp.]
MWLERSVSFSFLMLAVLFMWMSLELPFYESEGLPGAGFFPRFISGILILLTLYHVILLFFKSDKQEKRQWHKAVIAKQIVVFMFLILTLILTNVIGMLPAIGIFMFILLTFMQKIQWLKALLFTILVIIIMYATFVLWLNISLPKGIF